MESKWKNILLQPSIPHVIKPKTWGPHLWGFLHCLALSYPLHPSMEDQANMHRYFHAVKNILPCHMCKVDFTRMMEEDPIEYHLDSREKLCRWLVDKHNQVNSKVGAPQKSFEESVLYWCQDRLPRPLPLVVASEVSESSSTSRLFIFITFMLLLFFSVVFYFRKQQTV